VENVHARPIRCPRCRRKALVLVIDSIKRGGAICMPCHGELIALRRDRIATLFGHEPLAVRRERE